jgi:hypothetical protein
MTTTTSSTALLLVAPVFTNTKRLARLYPAPRGGGRQARRPRRQGYAAPTPLTTDAALGPTRGARHRPLSGTHAERYDLHALTAMPDAPAPRAESAICAPRSPEAERAVIG